MSENMEDGVVVLIDENGEEVEFEHLDTIDMDGKQYVVLLPMSDEGAQADEVIILKVEEVEDGDDNLISIDNEDELNAVFQEFKTRMEEEYEFEEE